MNQKINKQIESDVEEIVLDLKNISDRIKTALFLLKKIDLFSFCLKRKDSLKISLKIPFFFLLEKYFWQKGYYFPEQKIDIDRIVFKKKKRVVYTAIFGGKDKLLKPKYIPYNFDFLCYTDSCLKSNIWKVIREEPTDKDPVRSAKIYKVLPHKYLKDYDYSVWADGNLRVRGDLNKLVDNYLQDYFFAAFDHAQLPDKRNCIYEEAEALYGMHRKGKGKADVEVIKRQIDKYRKENYPKDNSLISGMILVRKHNDNKATKLMEDWWSEICEFSRRDQLSFNYVAWKNNFKINYIPGDSRNNEFFRHQLHVK